jgi:hypothetical protein
MALQSALSLGQAAMVVAAHWKKMLGFGMGKGGAGWGFKTEERSGVGEGFCVTRPRQPVASSDVVCGTCMPNQWRREELEVGEVLTGGVHA